MHCDKDNAFDRLFFTNKVQCFDLYDLNFN